MRKYFLKEFCLFLMTLSFIWVHLSFIHLSRYFIIFFYVISGYFKNFWNSLFAQEYYLFILRLLSISVQYYYSILRFLFVTWYSEVFLFILNLFQFSKQSICFLQFNLWSQCCIQMYFGTVWMVWAPKKMLPKKFS